MSGAEIENDLGGDGDDGRVAVENDKKTMHSSSSPPEPSEEELQLRRDIEETRRLVKFKKAEVKDIVSHHSSSILSKDDPEVPLDAKLEALSKEAFHASPACKDGHLKCDFLGLINALDACGFKYVTAEFSKEVSDHFHVYLKKLLLETLALQRRDAVVQELQIHVHSLTESEFVTFVQRFNAPSYYYGQRLRRYVARGQLADAIVLILRGCNANTSDGEGLSSVHYACEYNRPDIIESIHVLVKQDLVINGQDKYGWTPLHSACHHGNLACVQLLLKLGACILAVNKQGKTPFHLAASQSRSEIVDALILHDISVLNIKDNMDMTALMDAAFRNHKQVYTQLLDIKGIEVEHRDRLGYSAEEYMTGTAIAK